MFLKAALVATVIGAIRSRRLRFLAAWFALLRVPLTALGGILDPSRPTLTLTIARFWLPIMPAICLGGVGALYLMVRQEARRYGRMATHATAAALLGTAVPVGIAQLARLNDPVYVRNHGDDLGQLKSWLTKHSQDIRTLRSDPRTGTIEWLRSAREARPGEYVVVYWAADVCSQCQASAARTFGCKPTIPPAWVQVFANQDEGIRVFRVP